jgi:D-xylose transport system substrate-binding protein
VPSILLDPQLITKDSVGDVIADGGQKYEDVCTGQFEKLCADAGITP